ncbi:hypothetical protein EHZ19_28755 [Paraburkholderia bannensis]|nr:hypothetical protein [Paraburkholderia bannensis]RQM44439.1 hypothetical protein EHZ19_28755 [Paraburkholderia bannensis]
MTSFTSDARSTALPEIRSAKGGISSTVPTTGGRRSRSTSLHGFVEQVIVGKPTTITPTVADARAVNSEPAYERSPRTDRERQIERVQENRTLLLARRYEAKNTKEEDARYEILTMRMRRLSPRVTLADLERINTIADAEEALRAELDAMEQELGLR